MPNLTAPEGVVAVVLAAGQSVRFGGDKLLHPLNGKALAAHIADTLASMPLLSRIAICPRGNASRAALFASRGFEVIDNPDPSRGMGSSLALAARRAMDRQSARMLVTLGDMPNVTAEHLERLLAAASDAEAVATIAGGVRSPPVIFPRRSLPELAALTGDQGGRQLLRQAKVIAAPPELVKDFDLPSDFV